MDITTRGRAGVVAQTTPSTQCASQGYRMLYWRESPPRGGDMELKELPAELVFFVEQALASGTYASVEALVADAMRVLRDQDAGRTARPHPPETPVPLDMTTSTPDELVRESARPWKRARRGGPCSLPWRAPNAIQPMRSYTSMHECSPLPRPGSCPRPPRRGPPSRPMGRGCTRIARRTTGAGWRCAMERSCGTLARSRP